MTSAQPSITPRPLPPAPPWSALLVALVALASAGALVLGAPVSTQAAGTPAITASGGPVSSHSAAALAQLTPAHGAQRTDGVPASRPVRFTAAGTFGALPAMLHRGERGARLMGDRLNSPLQASAPLPFRGAVGLRTADDAAWAQRGDESRRWLQQPAASGAPQAALAQARLKGL